MKIVLIGDIGWRNLYHLGDEAMTEAAIKMLRTRGIDDITLTAGHPEVAEAFYGLPTVPRVGYWGAWSRAKMESRLRDLDTELVSHTDTGGTATDIITAIARADAVLIAGGGNMNSQHVQHLFERLSIMRIAKHFAKPLVVTSQTVGPLLDDKDVPLVKEILDYASLFGARESDTFELLKSFEGRDSVVKQCMDDAMMLTAEVEDIAAMAKYVTSRYVIASFAGHSRSTGMDRDAFYALLADRVDSLAERLDADVLLVPHAGSFDADHRSDDLLIHDEIFARTRSGRVTRLPMVTARQLVALTRTAFMSLSTRYHPAVFGPIAGIPAVTIVVSYYSSIRMRGALRNVGLEQFALPLQVAATPIFEDVLNDVDRSRSDYNRAILAVNELRLTEQSVWWDSIVRALSGAAPDAVSIRPVPSWTAGFSWAGTVDLVTTAANSFWQEIVAHDRTRSWGRWLRESDNRQRERADNAELLVKNRSGEVEDERRRADKAETNVAERDATIRKLRKDLLAARELRVVRLANLLGRIAKPNRKR